MIKAVLPRCVQICMDDLGWFNGMDARRRGGLPRSGMPRYHCAEDYVAINELGKRLNMRINAAFILGEWDPDNRLADIPYFTHFKVWDNATYIDRKEAEACADVIRNSPYIDMAIHGLMHSHFAPDVDDLLTSDYYHVKKRKANILPKDQLRLKLDHFFDLVEYYDFQKQINSFIPPSFYYRWNELSQILKEYGIQYVSTIFNCSTAQDNETLRNLLIVDEDGVLSINRENNTVPWYQYNPDLTNHEPVDGIFGTHWPNFLDFEPEDNLKVVERNVPYFEKCANRFGSMMSRDIGFWGNQALYVQDAVLTCHADRVEIDLQNVMQHPCRYDHFYLSVKQAPTSCTGGSFALYEKKDGYATYKITPTGNRVILYCK